MVDQVIASPPLLPAAFLRSAAGTPEETAKEFESVFLSQMLRPVFAEVSKAASFGGGAGERTFGPILTDAYAEAMAEAGGIGIADAVLAEIVRMQGLEEH